MMLSTSPAKFSDLNARVKLVIQNSTWFEKHGYDIMILLIGLFVILPTGLVLLRFDETNIMLFAIGIAMLGFCHHLSMVKAAHMFLHSALGLSERTNEFFRWVSIELIGGFPSTYATLAHVKIHHPHTNILGLGDSSSWRLPFLPRSVYMFVAPLFIPLMTPIVGYVQIWGRWFNMFTYTLSLIAGFGAHYCLLRYVSDLEPLGAVMCMVASRSVFMVPYIHVNVFQHIGLNMYTTENRPDRLTLMSTSVLNLPRHPFLDWCFGHSIISCHIEHHLFTGLSDSMCLKIKPTVKRFFEEHRLPYHEKTYTNRVKFIWRKYEELMVKGPPITDFVDRKSVV